jgi:O-antigen/teichoic acid export membrane protein
MLEVEVSVAKGAASIYLASVISLILNTGYFIILTNILSPQSVGLVSLLNVIILGIVTLATLALPVVGSSLSATPPAVTRFLSQYIGKARGKAARRIFLISLILSFVVSNSFLLLFTLNPVADAISYPLGAEPVLYAAIDAVILSLGQVGAYSLIGVGRAISAGSIIMLSAIIKYLSASSLLILGFGASGVFIGFSIGDFVLLIATLAIVPRSIPNIGDDALETRAIITYMLSILLSAAIGFGVSQMDRLLTFFQRGLSDLAVYNAASVGATIAAFAPLALTNVLVPMLSSHAGEERKEVMKNYTRYVSLIAFPMGFGLAAVAPSLLLIFGDNYVAGSSSLAVMTIAVSLTAINAVYSSSLLAGRKIHYFLLGNVFALLTLITFSALLVPLIGLVGVALGRAAMLFVGLTFFTLFTKAAGDFVLDLQGYLKALLGSAIMGMTIYILLSILSSSYLTSRLQVIFAAVAMIPLGMIAYLLIMKYLKAFNERDIKFIESLLPRPLFPLLRIIKKFLL